MASKEQDQKLQKYYQMQGFLEKKSPAFLKGWQSRYFIVRDQGKMLLYYSKQPKGTETKPSGILYIKQMQSITANKESHLLFTIVTTDRTFELKAKQPSDRNSWVEALNFLKDLKIKEEKQQPEEGHRVSLGDQARWNQLDNDTMNRIKLEEEKAVYQEVEEQLSSQNDEVLQDKGILPYLQKFNQDIIDKFVLCGFLMKKGKMAKLTMAKKRWFFLISSVPINNNPDDKHLQGPSQSDLPSVFKLNYIYYFSYDGKGDKSNYIGKIIIDNCEKAEIQEINKNEFFESLKLQKLPYGFLLQENKDDRQYHFFSEHLTEVNKWVNAINTIILRPNKGKMSMLVNENGVSEPVPLEEKQEEVLYEGPAQKKSQNKLLTGPLSWKKVTLQLKKNSLSWNYGPTSEENNEYVLLLNVTKVEGATKSWIVFTSDGDEFKFKAESKELKDEWVKKIEDQVSSIKENLNIPETEEEQKNQDQARKQTEKKKKKQKKEESEEEEDDLLTKSYYNKMALNIEKKTGGKDDNEFKEQRKSCFSRFFCYCYGGHDEDDDTDRGF